MIPKMKLRLNRYLAACGIASRRKSEEFIKAGRVSVNGKTVSELALIIDSENDVITLDGEKLCQQKKVYFLLNKPKGFITSTADEKGRKTVIDLIKTKPSFGQTGQKIFPVGRLDYNTTGVLLLTNDGDFTNFLTHPKNLVPREYKVTLNKELKEEDKLKLLKGINLDGKKSCFKEIKFLNKKNWKRILVITIEGRNHFVKNMFSALGYFVTQLERIGYGNFTAKGIPAGGYRKLSLAEIQKIYETYGK